MKSNITRFGIILTAFVMILTSGCSAPKPAGLTDEQLTGVADNILKAVDAGDFQKFSQDLSDQMKAAFTEDQFTKLRTMLQTASGSYLSIGKPALTNNQGYAVYRFPATYDDETVYVTLTFLIDGQKVEGFFLDSTNLREQPTNN
jgi:hypothetical protein